MPRTRQPASGCTTRLHKKRPTPTLTLEGTGIKPTQRVQLNSTQQCECTQMVNFTGRTKKRPQHDFVSRYTTASTTCDVQVHAADLQSGTAIRKKIAACISSHGDTQRNDKPHLNSAPEQAERPGIHHCISTSRSIPLAILEMLLPNHADKKNLKKKKKKKNINQRVSVHKKMLKALHSLDKKLQPPFG